MVGKGVCGYAALHHYANGLLRFEWNLRMTVGPRANTEEEEEKSQNCWTLWNDCHGCRGVCVCVCVWEREREREWVSEWVSGWERERERKRSEWEERERERERERSERREREREERERGGKKETWSQCSCRLQIQNFGLLTYFVCFLATWERTLTCSAPIIHRSVHLSSKWK